MTTEADFNAGRSDKRPVTGWPIAVGIVVLLMGAAGAVWMIKTQPKAEAVEAEAEIPLVEVGVLTSTGATVIVEAMGTVVAKEEVDVQAEVSGVVTGKHPELVEGGLIRQGETLLQLDARNYRYALQQKQAALDTANSDLRIEMGQQDIALKEWELIAGSDESGELDRELALRTPQRLAKEADVAAAQAVLARAQLDVTRTAITAPFNAVVTEAEASVGDQASAGTVLARLAGTDVFWINIAVRLDQLKWIRFPNEAAGESGSDVIVYADDGRVRHGRVFKRLAELDAASHMARILVAVEDPLNLAGTPDTPALLLNQYVRVDVMGVYVEPVCRIPRAALHDGSILWLLDEHSHLRLVPAQVVWSTREDVFINNALKNGQRMVLSNLGAPVEGMTLTVEGVQP